MSGIDLIPASYRKQVALRRTGRHVAMAGTALFCISVLSALTLQWAVHKEETAMKSFQGKASETAKLQGDIGRLSDRKLTLEQALAALAANQGKSEIPNALQALDAALNNDVWLVSLQIERLREKIDAGNSAPNSGMHSDNHISLVQHDGERWKIYRTLQLSGMATSYTAVADFIQTLSSQPSLSEVKMLNSGVAPGDQEHLFAFTATAILLPTARPLP